MAYNFEFLRNRWRCLLLSFCFLVASASTCQAGSVIGAESDLLDIDEGTGVGTTIGPLSGNITGVAFDPNTNTLYGADNTSDSLVTIDIASGATTTVGVQFDPSPTELVNVDALAFDANSNVLYGTDIAQDVLITINTTTGAGSIVGTLPGGSFQTVSGLAFDLDNDVLYGVDSFDGQLLTINTSTGSGTLVGSIAVLGSPNIDSLAYDSVTSTLYGSNSLGEFYSINPTSPTPVVTDIGDIGSANVQGLTAIPEASAFLYLAIVSSGCFWARKRMTGTDE